MKVNKSILFFIAYATYLLFCIFDASFYTKYICNFEKIVMIFCVALLLLYELLRINKTIKIKEFVFATLIFISIVIMIIHLNGAKMLPLLFFSYSARNINFKKIAKFTIYISTFAMITIIASAYMGIIENYKATTIEFGKIRNRTYMGFRYALYPQAILFNISLCYVYCCKNKLTLLKVMFLIAINYVLYTYTNARLSFFMIVGAIAIFYIYYKYPSFFSSKKLVWKLIIFIFPICAFVSIYITYNYNPSNDNFVYLNQALGGRLNLGKNSFSEYPINLFGHDTEFIGGGLDGDGNISNKKFNFVDCLYINMLEKYGIIFNFLILAILVYCCFNIEEKKKYDLLIIMFILAIHGMIDNLEMYLYYNAFWLISGEILLDKKEGKNYENSSSSSNI